MLGPLNLFGKVLRTSKQTTPRRQAASIYSQQECSEANQWRTLATGPILGVKIMTFGAMQLIPLSSAYLCQDCNCVGNNARQCPACASGVLMGLAGVLDRETSLDRETGLDRETSPEQRPSYLEMPALAA